MTSTDGRDRNKLVTTQRNSTLSLERCNPEIYANCSFEDIPCFHEDTTRNTAEALLLNNSDEGTFLIRRSETCFGDFSVSVRLANSVKHFHIKNDGRCFTFGQAQFLTPMQIWIHLRNSPVLECEEGTVAHLSHPYISDRRSSIPLPSCDYGVVTRQYETTQEHDTTTTMRTLSSVVLSKEGQLYKKKEGKNWKRRWFILNKNHLSFKKNQNEKKTRKTLDLRDAIHVSEYQHSKDHCFKIQFPKVAYMFSADSAAEKDTWIKLINWQIKAAEIQI